MLKSANVSKKERVVCPFGGLEGVYPESPIIVLPRGINNIKCKKKNKKNSIIKKGPKKGPLINYLIYEIIYSLIFQVSYQVLIVHYFCHP